MRKKLIIPFIIFAIFQQATFAQQKNTNDVGENNGKISNSIRRGGISTYSIPYKEDKPLTIDIFKHNDENVSLKLLIPMLDYYVEPNQYMLIRPVIQSEGNSIKLPYIILNEDGIVNRLSNDTPNSLIYDIQDMTGRRKLPYYAVIPYELWMEKAKLRMEISVFDTDDSLLYGAIKTLIDKITEEETP